MVINGKKLSVLFTISSTNWKVIKTVSKYYYTGRRKAQNSTHTYEPTAVRALNIHLFTRNIADSPLCRFGSIEDTQHFLFHYGYYTVQGNVLLNATSALTILQVFYVWDTSLAHEGNSSILTLNAPITTKVVCFSRLLKCIRSLYGKQCGPKSDYSFRSSLFGSTLFASILSSSVMLGNYLQQTTAATDFFRCILFMAL